MDTGVCERCSQEIELYAGISKGIYSQTEEKGMKLGKIYKRRGSAGNQGGIKGWEELPKVSEHIEKRKELGEEE